MNLKDYKDMAERAYYKQDAVYRSLRACLTAQLKAGLKPGKYEEVVEGKGWANQQLVYWANSWEAAAVKAQEMEELYLQQRAIAKRQQKERG